MFSFHAEHYQIGLPEGQSGFCWRSAQLGAMPRPHRHTELELNLVLRGTAAYLLGDRRYDLRRHSLVWLFPEQAHILLEQSPDYQMWVCVFKPALVSQVCATETAHLLKSLNPPGFFCKTLGAETASRLNKLMAEVAASKLVDPARHEAGLGYALLSAWAAWQDAPEAAGDGGADIHPAVEAAVRLLRSSEETCPTDLDRLAQAVGLSAAHLSRLFHAQVGQSVTEFRSRQRLERFFRLYGMGRRLTLLDAALAAGFGSYPQFHRVFTRLMGTGPAEFRRSQGTPLETVNNAL